MDLQAVTPEQFKQVQSLANHVITVQQKNTMVTIANFVALTLMQNIQLNKLATIDEVYADIELFIKDLGYFGASIFVDLKDAVERILVVHQKMMKLDGEKRLKLIIANPMELSDEAKKKIKGKQFIIN